MDKFTIFERREEGGSSMDEDRNDHESQREDPAIRGTGAAASSSALSTPLAGRKRCIGEITTPQCTEEWEAGFSRAESAENDAGAKRMTRLAHKKDGRDRAIVTGEYVGLANAKQLLIDKEKELAHLQAERELADELAAKKRARDNPAEGSNIEPLPLRRVSSLPQMGETAERLGERVAANVDIIKSVATRSKNLKGTFQRALKEAGDSILRTVEDLGGLTTTEENNRLRGENARLKAELEGLREEMGKLRAQLETLTAELRAGRSVRGTRRGEEAEMEEGTTVHLSPSATTKTGGRRTAPASSQLELPGVEELLAPILKKVGEMVNARLGALEDRLLPEPRLRPPHRQDKVAGGNKGDSGVASGGGC